MDRFITLTLNHTNASKVGEVVVNTRHINLVTQNLDGTAHVGINNYGAAGFNTAESYQTVKELLKGD